MATVQSRIKGLFARGVCISCFSSPAKSGRIKPVLGCWNTRLHYRSLKAKDTHEWCNERCSSKTETKKQHFWVSNRLYSSQKRENGRWNPAGLSFTKGGIAFFVPLWRYLWLAQTWMSKGRACFCPTPNPHLPLLTPWQPTSCWWKVKRRTKASIVLSSASGRRTYLKNKNWIEASYGLTHDSPLIMSREFWEALQEVHHRFSHEGNSSSDCHSLSHRHIQCYIV